MTRPLCFNGDVSETNTQEDQDMTTPTAQQIEAAAELAAMMALNTIERILTERLGPVKLDALPDDLQAQVDQHTDATRRTLAYITKYIEGQGG